MVKQGKKRFLVDRSNWMGELSENVRESVILSKLSIPGTHNSFTYSLNKTSAIGPDSPEWLQSLGKYLPIVRPYFFLWSRCQNLDVNNQLMVGVRYFDIRLAVKSKREIRVIHALYGDEISPLLQKIRDFLQIHKDEVVILDFQHMYAFKEEHHNQLEALIDVTFGKWICPHSVAKEQLTLNFLKSKDIRVIVIYPGNRRHYWSRSDCLNPWPNTVSPKKMLSFLNERLPLRDPNILYVSQGILTPDGSFILKHLLSSLRKALAPLASSAIVDSWLPIVKTNNIVIIDYIVDYPSFIDSILRKNAVHSQ
ncbi:PI-PLC X domain-containing protein 3 [Lepeophtheirus salmonis]|uniref:PI-PLC X domain-containing protein 3 n=1 Tax=Lepeophtheirus salmonis TaxID=72036 RepID=UPI001AE417EC|nr:PI-PLC X domain-containing protein 3-like [Lepeophtheirus salmonis]